MVEQQCAYPELDNKDVIHDTQHLLMLEKKSQKVVAYSRCLAPGVSYSGSSIGRVVVHGDYRGTGLARKLVREAIAVCKSHWPECAIEIGAQVYLSRFYHSLGFIAISDPYDEDGISHIDMQLK